MKRNEAIKQLSLFIKQFEDCKLEKREAKKILDFLEKIGMSPPPIDNPQSSYYDCLIWEEDIKD